VLAAVTVASVSTVFVLSAEFSSFKRNTVFAVGEYARNVIVLLLLLKGMVGMLPVVPAGQVASVTPAQVSPDANLSNLAALLLLATGSAAIVAVRAPNPLSVGAVASSKVTNVVAAATGAVTVIVTVDVASAYVASAAFFAVTTQVAAALGAVSVVPEIVQAPVLV
jgi:hypothetical protein